MPIDKILYPSCQNFAFFEAHKISLLKNECLIQTFFLDIFISGKLKRFLLVNTEKERMLLGLAQNSL